MKVWKNGKFTKTFKIRSECFTLYRFLEFYSSAVGIPKSDFFDIIITHFFDYFKDCPFNVKMTEVKELRKVKGFTTTSSVQSSMNSFCDVEHLSLGELVEASLGLYAFTHLDSEDLKRVNLSSWFSILS